jgi:hypothetical protein
VSKPDPASMWYEANVVGRAVAWLDDHTPGRLPWGHIWLGRGLPRGLSFHWPSGHGGFAFGFPLPRWLPGFVRPYQTDGPKRLWRGEVCPWWRESDLHAIVPLLPPGLPIFSRTRRLRRRGR